MPGEHKVHPYVHLEVLCRGEPRVRPENGQNRILGQAPCE
jgi:hypothetical protein